VRQSWLRREGEKDKYLGPVFFVVNCSVILKDTDSMPFGVHEGIPMKEVPSRYLKWLMDNVYKGNKPRGSDGAAVHLYICCNQERINEDCKIS
jgi:uncharacterized protein (DUF3820 family)